MKQLRQATLLRILTDEMAPGNQQPLFEEIVRKARDARHSGAIGLRGLLSLGRSGVLYTTKILRLSFESPIVIEIIDSEKKIRHFFRNWLHSITASSRWRKVSVVRRPPCA